MKTREVLIANRTYYVRTDANDNNSGLSNDTAGAFLTIQRAVNVVCDEIDLGGFDVVIQVADGAYNASVVLRSYVGRGSVTVRGNTSSPANVTITVSTGSCFSAFASPPWTIEGFTLSTTGSGTYCITINSAAVTLGAMRYGAAVVAQMRAVTNASIFCAASYTITGGSTAHVMTDYSSLASLSGVTVTITGTPAFSLAFANAAHASTIAAVGVTWSGTATGPRYSVNTNGVIDTNGGGANYFPGNAAGVAANGGQYV